MFEVADQYLADMRLGHNVLPKLDESLSDLFADLIAEGTPLGDLLVRKPTDYRLLVPSTPRYFLSAVKRPLSRASYHTLFFSNADDLNRAYIVLNSSVGYWWWRTHDGGINITSSTLRSLPIPELTNEPDLVAALEESEEKNLVVKMNAGKSNENVKHSVGLMARLNRFVVPEFAAPILDVHANSHIAIRQSESS
jgi:hypothetical protein